MLEYQPSGKANTVLTIATNEKPDGTFFKADNLEKEYMYAPYARVLIRNKRLNPETYGPDEGAE